MAEDSKVKVEKFDGKDFGWWKVQIEDLLIQKDLDIVLGEKPDNMKQEDWDVLDKKAKSTIRLSLTKDVAFNILKQTTARGIMNALSNMYEKPSASNKVFLIRQLVNTKLREGASVTAHINEFNTILSRLVSVDIKFEDELQAILLLSSLPDSWSGTVTAISSSSQSASLTFEGIRDLIISEDIRRRSSGESYGTVLHTEGRGRRGNRNNQGNRGNNRSRSRGRSKSRPRGQSKPKKDIVCWNCNESGHFRNQCTAPAKERKEVHAATESSDDALICAVESSVENWIMDSGASFHATSSTEFMKNLKTGNFGSVRLADDTSLKITGIGDVELNTSLGAKWTLNNVRIVPGLRRMLISVGQLDDQGYDVMFGNGQWKVKKGNLIVARGKKSGTLYTAESSSVGVHAMTSKLDSSTLWHRRLGHMSEKGMKILAEKGKLPGLKKVENEFCEPCVFGKQKRVSFIKTGRTPKTGKLELVHSDVYGPTSVSSVGGANYYVTFIDDSTRKVWVYFLKNKSEVYDTFRKWKSAVELETGLKVKCLKSDNGGEYISREFTSYCSEHGIRMIKTVPETPQQNGIAERMNRTLNERARSMRLHAGLPKMFWADAVNTAAYLINRGPSVPIDFKIPEEEWSGKAVNLTHLRIFGCSAYVKIKDSDRDKLDSKSKKCYFIGYGSDSMGYKLWDPQSRKGTRSRDVIFNESDMYANKSEENTEVQKEKETIEIETANTSRRQESAENPDSGSIDEDISEDSNSSDDDSLLDDEDSPEPNQTPPVQNESQWVRRSTRESRPPQRYNPSVNYLLLTDNGEPQTYSEAADLKDSKKWESAMKDEMGSLMKNKTWILTKLPAGKQALQNKWVFRIKDESDGSKRYKARLVVKGFQQKKGIDYNEIFSPVVKMTTIRLVLSIVAAENLHLEQLDVKTAFLHGDLEENIYMTQPEGFQVKGKENMVCKLKKSLYGLKQAPRQWYLKFDEFMDRTGYKRCQMDHCCYIKKFKDSYIILLLYVDDMLIAGSDMTEIKRIKRQLSEAFEMKDLGPANQILGMSITRDRKEKSLTLSQEKYIGKVLEKFNLQDAKIRSTPLGNHFKLSKDQSPKTDREKAEMAKVPYASAVGSLMYAMVCTRPDIAHAVGVVSRFMSNPGKEHWEAVKWLLRYLKGTAKRALCFRGNDTILKGFVDADLGGCKETYKSTTGFVFTLGGTAISWMSRLQKSVALSTTEAEYMAVAEAGKELIWLKNFLIELDRKQKSWSLFCDSQSAIYLAKNPVLHGRTKHIQLRYHFIRELISDGSLQIEKIQGAKNPANMFTKVVTLDKLRLVA